MESHRIEAKKTLVWLPPLYLLTGFQWSGDLDLWALTISIQKYVFLETYQKWIKKKQIIWMIIRSEIEYVIKKKLPTNKSPVQDHMVSLQILPNIQRRIYINPS